MRSLFLIFKLQKYFSSLKNVLWILHYLITQPIYPLRAYCKDMPSILKGALRLNSVIWKLFRYVKKVLLCDLLWHPKCNTCNAQEVIKKSFYTSRRSTSSLFVFVRLRDFYYWYLMHKKCRYYCHKPRNRFTLLIKHIINKRNEDMSTINTNNKKTSANAKKEIYVLSYPTWYHGWHVRILYFHTEYNLQDNVTREVFKYFLDTCKYWCSQVKGIEVIKSFIFSAKSTWVDLLLPHLLDLSRNNKINKGKIQWANINAYDSLTQTG